MVKIRLARMGAAKQPFYRVVVIDSRESRDGKCLEVIGHYNPRTDPPTITIDETKALAWLKKGAQPTEIAVRLMSRVGIWQKFTGTPGAPQP
jgi:small subunit ribosomal protein S16